MNWPSYMFSLGPADPFVLQEAPEIVSLSPQQTHPAVSWTAGCCSAHRSRTEDTSKRQMELSEEWL